MRLDTNKIDSITADLTKLSLKFRSYTDWKINIKVILPNDTTLELLKGWKRNHYFIPNGYTLKEPVNYASESVYIYNSLEELLEMLTFMANTPNFYTPEDFGESDALDHGIQNYTNDK